MYERSRCFSLQLFIWSIFGWVLQLIIKLLFGADVYPVSRKVKAWFPSSSPPPRPPARTSVNGDCCGLGYSMARLWRPHIRRYTHLRWLNTGVIEAGGYRKARSLVLTLFERLHNGHNSFEWSPAQKLRREGPNPARVCFVPEH